ncbi:MAG: hypothetical protein KAT16_09590, partial [Candidatus Heimdallarchaeota archaeon]|nr:hypothetical protein [Candidatus Heimdallarchaeota archaeon]
MSDSIDQKTVIDVSMSVSEAIELLKSDNSHDLLLWQNHAQNIVQQISHGRISYITNVFLPVTFLCRNACTYCNYKKEKMPAGEEFTSKNKILQILTEAKNADVSEIMITTGEKPETIYPSAEKWLS